MIQMHPKPEELTAFVYGEIGLEDQAQLKGHLEACPECQERVASMQRTRAQLQSWKLPAADTAGFIRPRLRAPGLEMLKAAAMVLVLIAVGFGLARLVGPTASDNARMRAQFTGEIREQLARQIQAQLTKFADSQAKRDQEYRAAIIQTFGRLEAQRAIELASLREDVENVALHTQDEWETTQEGLYELAASAPMPGGKNSN